jgi:protein-S-isoprenylcysteine O-methyltransferase
MTFALAMPILAAFWIATEALVFRQDLREERGERRDVGSRVGLFAGIGLGILLTFESGRRGLLALPGERLIWFALGALLVLGGIAIRLRAVRELGRFFRTKVTLLDDHRLVTSGLYAHLRHPAYTGNWLTCAGFGLASGTLAGFAAMILLPGVALLYRIRVEEKVMAERFGPEWTLHAARTRRIIPGLW